MRLILTRHGQSKGNVNIAEYMKVGDANVELTDLGWDQAYHAGLFLRKFYDTHGPLLPRLTVWTSSLLRTKQTTSGIVRGLGDYLDNREYRLHEDPRLVEQSYGLLSHLSSLGSHRVTQKMVRDFLDLSEEFYRQQPFTARVPFGESPQDAYTRIDLFLQTLRRDQEYQHIDHLIVTHGATIKAFLMRWFHLPMDAWDKLATPRNSDVFCIERTPEGDKETTRDRWRVRKIYDGESREECDINPIAHIRRLDVESLPVFPGHLKNEP